MVFEEDKLVMQAIIDLQKPPYVSEVKSDRIAEHTGLSHQKVKDILETLRSKFRVEIYKLMADIMDCLLNCSRANLCWKIGALKLRKQNGLIIVKRY